MKKYWLTILLATLVVLGSASGWVYQYVKSNPPSESISKDTANALQVSFMKSYGTSATLNQMIIPKIYEVAWTDDKENNNVSMNIGGVWVLIASQPAKITTPPTTTPIPQTTTTP